MTKDHIDQATIQSSSEDWEHEFELWVAQARASEWAVRQLLRAQLEVLAAFTDRHDDDPLLGPDFERQTLAELEGFEFPDEGDWVNARTELYENPSFE